MSAVSTIGTATTGAVLGVKGGLLATYSISAALSGFCLGSVGCCLVCKCVQCCCAKGDGEEEALIGKGEVVQPSSRIMTK